MKSKLTVEDGRKAFAHHVIERALALREKYGPFLDSTAVEALLEDREFVRYPTRVVFDSSKIGPGYCAAVEEVASSSTHEHVIFLHDYFRRRPGEIAHALLYQLVLVNYGDIATREEAELFGATALGLEQEEYYQTLCHLTDQIFKQTPSA